MEINALLDLGSNVTIMSNAVVNKLCLSGNDVKPLNWNLGGVNCQSSESKGFFVPKLNIRSIAGDELNLFNVKTTERITDYKAHDWSNLSSHINESILSPVNDRSIDLLIGTDNIEFLLFKNYRVYKNFTALETILGWTVSKRNPRFNESGYSPPAPVLSQPHSVEARDVGKENVNNVRSHFVLDPELEEHNAQEHEAQMSMLLSAESQAVTDAEEAISLHGSDSTQAQLKREEIDVQDYRLSL